ncbi:DUF6163 family protein [Ahrensia sp. R2A130]|uniref:DUF6163 family protein n=1 Tax=Ahrensia sp. R2A130 TaxID=744979 RepID=UPI0001E08C07|nr:DUF6163 family protein [Ahrensia sp. R2A130]EFL90534.1 conserved hypothetical protein [Ahrensia sp. R2A130]
MVILANEQRTKTGAAKVVEVIITVFLGLVALGFFALAVHAWLRMIGFWPGDANSFDTMDATWRSYSAVQAVLLPVVAVGLWTGNAWGRVVWFMAVALHCAAFFTFASGLQWQLELLIFHGASLAIYLVLLIVGLIVTKKA